MGTRNDIADGLTAEQLVAAGTPHRRVYIEAAPGSGKTTVAAQRFGIQRFQGTDQRAVLAVSFTRSATAELRDRVLRQWGPDALAWPHRIVTLDTVVCDLLGYLLDTGHVSWPSGHHSLTVIDSWQVQLPTKWSRIEPIVALAGNRVVVETLRRSTQANRPSRQDVATALAEGFCTHQDARTLLEAALALEGACDAILARLADTAGALIVDEIFDANAFDLSLVRLAVDAGLDVTVVGDPWQALYGFRGARPDLVPELVRDAQFVQRPLRRSFRWRTDGQERLADELRAGHGVILRQGQAEDMDVVLSLQWKTLWSSGPHVLPLAYGSAKGQVHEAACTLLLSEVTQQKFGVNATFHKEALIALDIDAEALERLRPGLQQLITDLAGSAGIAEIWSALNDVVGTETRRRLPKKRNHHHTARLDMLRARLHAAGNRLIPGLTAHQAKGREWNHVGVLLTNSEREALAAGLVQDREDHRALYVALTRAKQATCGVADGGSISVAIEAN
ncbi:MULTISPECIES: UvrD-helicase domain-containing protein [unclassified Streptomyces]|uniref:UvrD-helicase domain-containing protein n=1 Tax=unclassified Streptomyces TaxID=2593676 RepID=UPI00364C370A